MNNTIKKEIYKYLDPIDRKTMRLVSKQEKEIINNLKLELSRKILHKWKNKAKELKNILNYIHMKRLNGDVYFTTNEARIFKNMNISNNTIYMYDYKIPENLKYKNNNGIFITGNYPQFILISNNNKNYIYTQSQLTIHNNNGNIDVYPYLRNANSFKDLLRKILIFKNKS